MKSNYKIVKLADGGSEQWCQPVVTDWAAVVAALPAALLGVANWVAQSAWGAQAKLEGNHPLSGYGNLMLDVEDGKSANAKKFGIADPSAALTALAAVVDSCSHHGEWYMALLSAPPSKTVSSVAISMSKDAGESGNEDGAWGSSSHDGWLVD